jgi:hypothetical protein
VKKPIRSPDIIPIIIAPKIPHAFPRIISPNSPSSKLATKKVSGREATAAIPAERNVPICKERSRDFWSACSLVLTKKVPISEAIIPATEIKIGSNIPPQL